MVVVLELLIWIIGQLRVGCCCWSIVPPKTWEALASPTHSTSAAEVESSCSPSRYPCSSSWGRKQMTKLRPSGKSGGFCRTHEAAKWIFFFDKLYEIVELVSKFGWCSEIQCIFVSCFLLKTVPWFFFLLVYFGDVFALIFRHSFVIRRGARFSWDRFEPSYSGNLFTGGWL